MSATKNTRKINNLLKQMEQQTGYADYKNKVDMEQKKHEEFSAYIKDLAEIDRQDPLRVSPLANENNREERKIEELRHKERQNIMVRVNNRQRLRGSRTYS